MRYSIPRQVSDRRQTWRIYLSAVLAIAATAGCAASHSKEVVSTDLDIVTISPQDLGVSGELLSTTGGRPLDSTGSKGRFPAGLAVAKVVSKVAEPGAAPTLKISETSPDHAAYWNGLLDSLPPVREVAMLHDVGFDPRGTTWRDILSESVRIDCHLCLVYGRCDRGAGDADLIGVLWDASQSKALAAFRIPLAMDKNRREEEDDPQEGVSSPAENEAVASLRALVRGAVWDLAKRDTPTATTQPSPWQSDPLLMPRNNRMIIEIDPKQFREHR